jgi:hypothetical protein
MQDLEVAPGETDGARELIDAAAEGRKLEPEAATSALDWLLTDEPEEAIPTHTLELNVGGAAREDGTAVHPDNPPQWIKWTVQAVEEGVIRRIFREAAAATAGAGNRAARRRRTGEGNDDANLRIVVAATVDPDLRSAAHQKGIADPSTVVRMRFKHKAGLLGAIADAVMDLSGFNDDDVRDAREVRAAGN